MAKFSYLVTGSEDGPLGVFTSSDQAIKCAESYQHSRGRRDQILHRYFSGAGNNHIGDVKTIAGYEEIHVSSEPGRAAIKEVLKRTGHATIEGGTADSSSCTIERFYTNYSPIEDCPE